MANDITKTGPVGLKGVNRQDSNKKDVFDLIDDLYKSGKSLTPESTRSMWASPAVENVGMQALNAGYGESKFDRYASYEDLDNLNELRAAKQNAFGQLMNGVGKMGVLTGTTFLDNTIGTVVGLLNFGAQAISGNINSGSDALYAFINNPVSSFLQDVNNKSEEWMPNYESEYEQNLPWWKKLGTANFIGDHFLKNLGFFAGAYFSGMASAKLLTSATAINKTKQLFKGVTNTKGEALKSASDILKAYKTGDAIMDGQKLADNIASAAKKVRNQEYLVKIGSGIAGSMGESRMEALSGSEEDYNYRFELLQQQKQQELDSLDSYLFENYPELFVYSIPQEGGNPIPRVLKQEGLRLKAQLAKGIEEKYKAHETELANNRIQFANNAFLWNLAVTSLDNIYQFGEAFTGGITKARGLAAVKKLATGAYEGEKKGVVGNVIDMLSSPVSEGTQEMLQRSIQMGEERWSAQKFNNYYGIALDPKALDAKKEYLTNFFNATADVYTDLEEWENFFLGAITSLIPLPGGGSRFWTASKANKEEGEYNQSVAESMNAILSDPKKREWLFHLSRLDSANNKQEEALDTNDSFSFKNAEIEKAISSVITYTQGGKFQDYLDLIENVYDVTENDIDSIKALAVDKETNKSLFEGMTDEQILEHFKSSKETALSNAKKIHDVYSNMSALFTGQSQEFINEVTYLASTINDRESRIKQITNTIKEILNQDIHNFEDVYGYNPIETLDDIHNINTYFSDEDKRDLFESTIQKKNKKSLERAKAKQSKRKEQQGRIWGLNTQIKKLEEKQLSIGLSEEEETKLKDYKKRRRLAKTSLTKAINTIKDLKSFLDLKNETSKIQASNVRDQLEDLVHLINERELLVDSLNTLQKNPSIFEDSLAKDIAKSYNSYVKRKKDRNYNELKSSDNLREAIKQSYSEGKFSPKSLEDLALENNDENILKEVKTINKLQSISRRIINIIEDKNGRIYEGSDKGILNIKNFLGNQLLNITQKSSDEIEAIKTIEGFLVNNSNAKDPIVSKLSSNILKEFSKSKENTTTSSNKKTTENSGKDTSDKNNELLKYKKNPSLLDKMSLEDLKKLVVELDLLEMLNLDPEDLDSFGKTGLAETVKMELESYTPTTKTEDTNASVRENEDFKDNSKEEFEVSSDTKPVVAPKRKEVERVKPAVNVFDSSMSLGQPDKSEADNYSEGETSFDEGSDWTSGRRSSSYEIGPLKDPNERKAIKRDYWYSDTFDKLHVTEFVDSGELSKLWLLADSIGESLYVTFVQLRGQGNAKENTYGKQDLFLAVDWEAVESLNKKLPKELQYKKPEGYFEYDFFKDAMGNHSKMQIIGKFDIQETEEYERLQKTIEAQVDSIKYVDSEGNIKRTKFAASNITTTLDWVFSGRLVKQNEAFDSIQQRDLLDIIPKKDEELINLDGEIQLAIVTPNGEVVVGDDLDGEVIELNKNRPKSDITHNPRRLATPWIKIREADGRVYYKSIRVKNFDSNYTSDESPIAKRIKNCLNNILNTKNEEYIKNNISALRQYLYIPDSNKIYVNFKTSEITIGDNSINLTSTIDELYDFIKSQGYQFTFGLDEGLSLMDTINSDIFTTDLAQLHNANASLVVGKILFSKDGSYTVHPHDELINKLHSETHLGKKGFQPGRGFSAPIKLQGDDTIYIKSDDGTYYIEVDGHREEATDLSDTKKLLIDFMVEMPGIPIDKNVKYFGRRGSKSSILIYPYKVGNATYYITNKGYLLNSEDVLQFKVFTAKNVAESKKEKAKIYLEKALKGKSDEEVTITPEDVLNGKKRLLKTHLDNNNLTEISDKDLRDLFKMTRKEAKTFRDTIIETDGLVVDGETIKIVNKQSQQTVSQTTVTPNTLTVTPPVIDPKFTSRRRLAREKAREKNKPVNNHSILNSEEITKMTEIIGDIVTELPNSLQGLRSEILHLLSGAKSFNGLKIWLNDTLANPKINTSKIEEHYKTAFSEKFSNKETLKSLFTEIKQTLEC